MKEFMIICETCFVSRGTIRTRKTNVIEGFEKLIDAEFALGRLYNKYKKEMSNQLDKKLKSVSLKDNYLILTINNGDFSPIESRLYYIYKKYIK